MNNDADRLPGTQGARIATVHLHQTTASTPEQFVAGLTDFGPLANTVKAVEVRNEGATSAEHP